MAGSVSADIELAQRAEAAGFDCALTIEFFIDACELGGQNVHSYRVESGLDHQLFQSLTSHVDVHWRTTEFASATDSEYGVTGRLGYRKTTPWGFLTTGYAVTADRIDRSGGFSPDAFGIAGPPKPDLLVYNTNQCREVQDWWNYYARRDDVPVMGVCPPTHLGQVTPEHVGFVRTLLERMIEDIEAQFDQIAVFGGNGLPEDGGIGNCTDHERAVFLEERVEITHADGAFCGPSRQIASGDGPGGDGSCGYTLCLTFSCV